MSDPEDVVEAETGRAPSDATPGGMTQSFDFSSPQADYRAGIEAGGFFEPAPGMAIALDRATVEHVLRHHELFSSRIEMRLGNVRPLIPLNVDPPQHSKYRKLLDPLFAPRRMDEQEEDITRRVNRIRSTARCSERSTRSPISRQTATESDTFRSRFFRKLQRLCLHRIIISALGLDPDIVRSMPPSR